MYLFSNLKIKINNSKLILNLLIIKLIRLNIHIVTCYIYIYLLAIIIRSFRIYINIKFKFFCNVF